MTALPCLDFTVPIQMGKTLCTNPISVVPFLLVAVPIARSSLQPESQDTFETRRCNRIACNLESSTRLIPRTQSPRTQSSTRRRSCRQFRRRPGPCLIFVSLRWLDQYGPDDGSRQNNAARSRSSWPSWGRGPSSSFRTFLLPQLCDTELNGIIHDKIRYIY